MIIQTFCDESDETTIKLILTETKSVSLINLHEFSLMQEKIC